MMIMLKRSTKQIRRTRLKGKIDRRLVEWAAAVKARAEGWCQRHRAGGQMVEGRHAHHVAPRSRRPDLKYDVSNGRFLCFECHNWCHSNVLAATSTGWLSDAKYEAR
jgi:hypothetical protein